MICSYCKEEHDHIFEPPLVRVSIEELKRQKRHANREIYAGRTVYWRAPTSAYPGAEPYEVHTVDGAYATLIPPETYSDDRLCFLCYTGRVWPALHLYLCNKPEGLTFNGYRDPVYIAPEPGQPTQPTLL